MDAEGSFISILKPRKNKNNIITSYGVSYQFQIGLKIIDKPILELISKNLNDLGCNSKIFDYPDKKESTLVINSIEGLSILIDKVFSIYPLLTRRKSARYDILRKGIINKINKVNSPRSAMKNIKF